MTHHAHSESERAEYESAEHEYEDLVRQLENVKYDTGVDEAVKKELGEKVVAARERFEELSHAVTGVVGPQSAHSADNNAD